MKTAAGSADTARVRLRWWWALLVGGLIALPSCALAQAQRGHHEHAPPHPVPNAFATQRFGVVNAAGWGADKTLQAARLGITTDRIEMDPGDPPGYDDALMMADVSAGLRPLPVLNIYANLATLARKSFTAWALRTAARYGRGGAFWRAHAGLNSALSPDYFEFLNEPNSDGPAPDASSYAHLFASTVLAARSQRVPARWLLASAYYFYTDASGVAHSWDQDLTAAVPDITSLAAGVTVHPYGPRSRQGPPDSGWPLLSTVHADFPTLPVWITEVGYSSTKNPAGMAAGEQEKARAIRWYVRQAAATPWVKALLIYGFVDAGPDPKNPEDNYGLVSYPGSAPLPAYGAYRQALRALTRCATTHAC